MTNQVAVFTGDGTLIGYVDFVRTATGVGIGTNTPSAKLHVSDGAFQLSLPSGAGLIVSNNASGDVYIDTTGVGSADEIDFFHSASAQRYFDIGQGASTLPQFRYFDIGGVSVLFDSTGFTFNDGSLDRDFRIESDNDAYMFFVDAGNDRVGIGTSTPASKLDVNGLMTVRSNLNMVGTAITNTIDGTLATDAATVGQAYNAANQTNRHASISLGPITTNVAPNNYVQAGPIRYASTATNLVVMGDGGSFIGDFFICGRTNPVSGRTLIYTGATYTAGNLVSNFAVNTDIAIDQWIGFVLTNGVSPTNAWMAVEITY